MSTFQSLLQNDLLTQALYSVQKIILDIFGRCLRYFSPCLDSERKTSFYRWLYSGVYLFIWDTVKMISQNMRGSTSNFSFFKGRGIVKNHQISWIQVSFFVLTVFNDDMSGVSCYVFCLLIYKKTHYERNLSCLLRERYPACCPRKGSQEAT